MQIDDTKALAGHLPISESALMNVRAIGQLEGPVLATRFARLAAA
jgi:acyl homoserine lactone synthase